MRGAPLVAVTILALVAAACGGGAPPLARTSPTAGSAHPSPSDTTSTSRGASSSSASLGSPAPAPTATPAPTAAPTPTPVQTAAAATSTAAPAAVPAHCEPGDVGITTTTDMSDYSPGQNVQISVIVRNIGTRACDFSASGQFTIDYVPASSPTPAPNAQPSTVFVVTLRCPPPPSGCPPLAPGQMSTYPIGWNQSDDRSNTQVPNGNYEAQAAFTGFAAASAPFRIG